jgi:hypothetical protein
VSVKQSGSAPPRADEEIRVINLKDAVHIVNGDSPGGCLRVGLRLSRDQVLVSEDPLSSGPAPATADLGVWRSIREKYIRELLKSYWPNFSFDEYADHGLLMNAEHLGREKAIVAWAGLGLQDQLLLAWVVFLFDRLSLDISKLLVVQFDRLPSGQEVFSIGELPPETLRAHHPVPRRLDFQEAEELRRLWKVYTSDEPAVLSNYAAGSSPMPITHRAVSRLLYRYPDVRSGLGVWDERLLCNTAKNGPKALRVIGHTMASESLDRQGDPYLLHRLTALASCRSPLVSLSGNPVELRDCEAELTSVGADVLAGKVNNVHQNGIDDWVGGVHLTDKGRVTFRSGDSLILS